MKLEKFKEKLENELENWFDREEAVAPTEEYKQLLGRMSQLVMRGGKRARPELLYLTYEAFNGKNPEKLLDLGLALELHHQFLLIHDDIMDNDTVRYNGPNIIGFYQHDRFDDSQNVPLAMGILAGDLAYTFAYQAIVQSKSYSDSEKIRLLRLINDANRQACVGQQLDVINPAHTISDFSLKKLLQIHELKSSSYSTKLPMFCAAALLALSANDIKNIESFASPFGTLFQLVDDHSDYFDNLSVFNNRPKYRDFRQGKITYPLYAGFKYANNNQRESIMQRLGIKNTPDSDMKKVVDMLIKCGAESESQKVINRYMARSRKAIDGLAIIMVNKSKFDALLDKYAI